MKKIIVIGSPGAGKTTFARALQKRLELPLYHLDLLWHKADRTTVTHEEFDTRLRKILDTDAWIIDGNYQRTLPLRLKKCDTVFLLDYPTEVCLEAIRSRIGQDRPDLPWKETSLDPEFEAYVRTFRQERLPRVYAALQTLPPTTSVIIFRSRAEAAAWGEM